MKPSLELRHNLLKAGLDNNDPLSIMNAFLTHDFGAPREVHTEYWETMIAVLCERCAAAEKELKELKKRKRKKRD